jgi:hypothetical protein
MTREVKPMALANLMELSTNKDNVKIGISIERIRECLPELRKAIAFYREYPDLYIDFCNSCAGEGKKVLKLYTYQRIFLRQAMRYRHVYAVYPRAYSKSFLSVLTLMLRCIFYPGCHLFVTTGGKEQATGIVREKAEELCKLVPGLANEVNFDRGKSKSSKEEFTFLFKNGSILDVMASTQRSRGRRATGGLIEEVILVDGTILNEVIIPTMNVSRLLPDGSRHDEEIINKSQIYVTTAGWKNTFAYDKLMMTLLEQITQSESAVIMGGTWRIPVAEGLLSKNFVQQLKLDGTYNDSSFGREYESEWSGDAENAYFSSEVFDKHRILNQPEYEFSGRSNKSAYYTLGIDVGRKGCTTECCVIKTTPQVQGSSLKSLVNLYSWEEEHFEQQAINIKKLFFKYKARVCAIDANGLGIGLIDYMVKPQVDPETGDILPPFGVYNSDEYPEYKKFKTPETIKDAMYLIKANAPINTEAHSYVQTQMSSGKLKFLIDETTAKLKLLETKMGQAMTPEKRAEYLMPFTLTTSLREQMLNLVEDNEGVNIILKQSSRGIPKDKFSAFEYGLLFIKREEERRHKRRGRDLSGLMLFN